MAFVINVIKWLLWTVTVETMYFDVVEPIFYIYSNQIVFRLNQLGNAFNIFTPRDVQNTIWPVNTPRNHETLTQCFAKSGPTVCDAGKVSNQYWFNAHCVCWAVGLAVHTAGGEYKPTLTQCLLNVEPASPVLASIHSILVSTSCWQYWHDALPKGGLMLARRF